ncbi:MAG: sigma-70 family RNA polymerase sigma factor [Flavobacteriales bacterium]|nr:sigma-70 family RNA polymerase sigma factor [Flavobacteriales bacterium]
MNGVGTPDLDDLGSQQLMARWVKSHTGDLVRYARSRVKDPDTADDLVQLTFVSAWQGMEKFARESSPRTWLFSILKHKLADHYRKAYSEGQHLSGIEIADDDPTITFAPNGRWTSTSRPTVTDHAFDQDEKERLDRALVHCLEHLPDNLRAAVEMKYLLEKDGKEIQRTLGISATNYWQQLHRAKLKLRKCIEDRLDHNN